MVVDSLDFGLVDIGVVHVEFDGDELSRAAGGGGVGADADLDDVAEVEAFEQSSLPVTMPGPAPDRVTQLPAVGVPACLGVSRAE